MIDQAEALRRARKSVGGFSHLLPDVEHYQELTAMVIAAAILQAAEDTQEECRTVLEPFATFHQRMLDGPDYTYMRERIKDWFGVSDFKLADEVIRAMGKEPK